MYVFGGRLGQFWWKTWKVFATKHIGNNNTMARETHGIHGIPWPSFFLELRSHGIHIVANAL